ncbi:MAG: DUF4157 domain-containing protein [Alphaproteobacteria bacterium]|nr:DUF4157 domain-containing protein [Alphaproteobacteria bacterium]
MKALKIAKRVFLGLMLTASSALGLDFGGRQVLNKKTPLPENYTEDARSVFGNTVDYSKVRISFGKVSCLQSSTTVATIGNTIYFPTTMKTSLDYFMIHEMTHIWQQQNNIKGTGVPGVIDLWRKYPSYQDSYAYRADSTKALSDYNLEQQGDIVSDYYWLKKELGKEPTREAFNECSLLRKIINRDIPQPELQRPAVFAVKKPGMTLRFHDAMARFLHR